MDFTSSSPQISPAAASQTTVTVTLTNFCSGSYRSLKTAACAGRFLGDLVRALQATRTDHRKGRRPAITAPCGLPKLISTATSKLRSKWACSRYRLCSPFFNGHPVDGFNGRRAGDAIEDVG